MAALSDSEICERFGHVFAEFDHAIRSDPWLLVDVVERMTEQQRIRDARSEQAKRQGLGRNGPMRRRVRTLERNLEIENLRGQGLSHAAIAERVGATPGAVAAILYRARRREADTP